MQKLPIHTHYQNNNITTTTTTKKDFHTTVSYLFKFSPIWLVTQNLRRCWSLEWYNPAKTTRNHQSNATKANCVGFKFISSSRDYIWNVISQRFLIKKLIRQYLSRQLSKLLWNLFLKLFRVNVHLLQLQSQK